MKTITGFNENTAKNLMVDAGAVFVNFDIEKDTIETAKGKLIGATSGGNEFEAKPKFRQIKVDGVKGKVKGLNLLESWEVKLKTHLLEFKKETFEYALAGAKVTDATIQTDKKYKKIEGKNHISESDYIDNITYAGNISGSNEPVIIQIFNALNNEGLKVKTKDADDIVAELEFEGYYSVDKLDNPPFAIYYPDRMVEK
ncbi:hypothetical protein [Clostridium niameyense]|uniref:hypothetical protein n=1 Tax=Clostridium niameyense TaxID=1622073 RepID=UPI00067EFB5E|nr:hypothetical protein [Clostridium niameyense]